MSTRPNKLFGLIYAKSCNLLINNIKTLIAENSPYDERELLSQLRLGSEQAFEKIYKQYSARLYGNLLRLVKSDIEAQEILQDVFLKIWNSKKHINTEKSFRSWLFKIAENKVYDFFRKAARDKKKVAGLMSIASSVYLSVDELLKIDEKAAFLQKAIESLPPQRQQIFRFCKLEGKSYKEVSELLKISVSTISDHVVKATKTIRIYSQNNEQAFLGLFVITFLATV
jgi:RNA polymerase sigma-70 factor (family 1)